MRGHVKVSLVAVTVFLWLASLTPAWAGAPTRIWVTLGEDAATQMVVSFAMDANVADTQVEYGVSSPSENTKTGLLIETMGNPIGFAYHAHLDHLLPATTYQYRIRVSGQTSDTYHFTTAPVDPCAPVQFIAMGDSRSQLGGSAFGNSFLRDAAATGASFMVNTGDLVKNGSILDEWANYLDDTTDMAPYIPLMPVIGNHDDGPGDGNDQHITKLFHTPTNGLGELRSHYYFEYGNAIFIVVTNHDGEASSQQQAEWLDGVLEASSAAWKMVFIHEPFFTCPGLFGLMGHEPDEKKVAQYFFPVFAKHNVDMVFTGHNHMYELFSPHDGNGFVNSPAAGTVHVTTGGAAEAAAVAMLIEPALTCQGRMSQGDQIHFLSIRILGEDLVLEYYPRGRLGNDPKPAEFHFGIKKNIGIDCSTTVLDGDEPDGDLPDGDTDTVEDGDVETDPTEDGDADPGDPDDPDDPVICEPDAIECRDNTVMKCNRVGTRWVALEDCGEKVCKEGRCVEEADSPDGDVPQPDGDTPEPEPGAGTGGSGCHGTGGVSLPALLGLFAVLGGLLRRRRAY